MEIEKEKVKSNTSQIGTTPNNSCSHSKKGKRERTRQDIKKESRQGRKFNSAERRKKKKK